MRFLVVDDEFVSRSKMARIMESFGKTVAVDNGKDAIEAFSFALDSSIPFDLVLLDYSMPDMDGTEVCVKLKEIEKNKNINLSKRIKIIMVTAHADEETVHQSIKAGCDGYVVKPFNKKMMVSKLVKLGITI